MDAEPSRDNAELTELVLSQEEASRAVAFGRTSTILGTLGFVLICLPPLDLTMRDRVQLAIPTVALTGVGASMWHRAVTGRRYSRPITRVLALLSMSAAIFLVYTLGVFTPVVVLVMLGLGFEVRDHVLTTLIPRGMTASYMVIATLVAVGVLPDVGLWRIHGFQQHVAMTVAMGAIFLMQAALVRASRRALLEAVTKTRELARVVGARETQLGEAREVLDVALRRGASGRLTGQVIGGYRAGEIVGRGAMGEVYAGISESGVSRPVAIKVLLFPDDDEIARRFLREAEIAMKVRGPNLVEVLGMGRMDGGALYIVMELLEGRDLAAILRERTTLPLDEVIALVDAVACGLDVLHAAGVIHRDVKPQNLFLSNARTNDWKILDYGVSKLVGAGTMTSGDIVGTPAYMSPEQAAGDPVDRRSDVFSLGAVAYRALTGRRPFEGAGMPQILYEIVHGKPTRPRELDPSISRDVEAVLLSALAKKPDDRYSTASELAGALSRASAIGPSVSDDLDEPTVTTTPERLIAKPGDSQ